jgi:hypothetical protein
MEFVNWLAGYLISLGDFDPAMTKTEVKELFLSTDIYTETQKCYIKKCMETWKRIDTEMLLSSHP